MKKINWSIVLSLVAMVGSGAVVLFTLTYSAGSHNEQVSAAIQQNDIDVKAAISSVTQAREEMKHDHDAIADIRGDVKAMNVKLDLLLDRKRQETTSIIAQEPH